MANSVDRAYFRCQLLINIVERSRRLALANPTDRRNVDLGLVEAGLKKQDAEAQISSIFDEISGLLNHVSILDMAAAFELQLRAWLGTAIGEARKVVNARYDRQVPLYLGRNSLVREIEDFEGLARIENLLISLLTAEVAEHLKLIRVNRNNFSHGTNTNVPPTITSGDAKAALDATIAAILTSDA